MFVMSNNSAYLRLKHSRLSWRGWGCDKHHMWSSGNLQSLWWEMTGTNVFIGPENTAKFNIGRPKHRTWHCWSGIWPQKRHYLHTVIQFDQWQYPIRFQAINIYNVKHRINTLYHAAVGRLHDIYYPSFIIVHHFYILTYLCLCCVNASHTRIFLSETPSRVSVTGRQYQTQMS